MSILLPSYPSPTGVTPSYLDWGGTLRPVFGGALQKLLRLGDRFAIDVAVPPLPDADIARVWTSRMIQAQRQGAILAWPQLDFDVGAPGAPLVNGGGQAGSVLNLDGFTPGYAIREGQFFSIIHGGRRYLHMSTTDIVVAANGSVALPIAPMLRISPANNAVCEFAVPMIEGFLEGDSRSWTIDVEMTVGLSFQITEAR